MRKRTMLVTALAAVALAGGGAAVAVADGHDAEDAAASRSSAQVSDHADDATQPPASRITAAEAAEAASAEGRVTSVELESEHGGVVWEADVRGGDGRWYEVVVDAGNGKVLTSHVDHDDGGGDDD